MDSEARFVFFEGPAGWERARSPLVMLKLLNDHVGG